MITIEEIKKLIPQKYPFLMLDRVTEFETEKSITAYKNISANESFFNGHFPDNPIFPGSLTAEAMAQAACILLKKSIPDLEAKAFYVTNIKIRFSKIVIPGDQLKVIIKTVKMTRMGGVFETEAKVNDDTVAKGEMTFACK